MSPEQTVCFSSFRLDLPNQRLCGREDPIPLRPKTFGVLRYLVEHAGRLVTREELVKAVWPDMYGAGNTIGRSLREELAGGINVIPSQCRTADLDWAGSNALLAIRLG